MQDELQRTLGASRPGVSNTMPISAALPAQNILAGNDPYGSGSILQATGGQNGGFVSPPRGIVAGDRFPSPSAPLTPKHAFEGFDFSRAQDVNKSAKDSFADLSNNAPPPPLNDKAALAQWFDQYIRPGMDSRGHKVSSVNGDSFSYGNHEGNFTVDYGRGAGAEGGALAWQAEAADDATRSRYGTPAGGGVPAIGNQNMAPVMPGQGSDLMAQLMAALQAQQEQPIDPQSLLLEQLR